jgi:pectate lyase
MRIFGLYRTLFLVIILLSAISQQAKAFESSPIGWASVADTDPCSYYYCPNGTTGGAGGPTVTATTAAELTQYATSTTPGPLIIQVQGTITLTADIEVSANKTIIGIGTDPTITGAAITLDNVVGGSPLSYNIIIRNLILGNSGSDAITISDKTHHVWVDHCDLSNCSDGALDISHASEYITISWNRFHNQDKTCLLGHSDSNGSEDTGHLKVTYHHNLFEATTQRNPRVRFSFLCHVYNNYYNGVTSYGVASTCDAYVLLEGNYFQNVLHPLWSILYSGSPNGWSIERYNIYDNSGTPQVNPPASMPEPSTYYAYTLDPTANIPTIVTNGAGVNKMNDSTAPSPDPMTFAVAPQGVSISSISMVATTATDSSGVEYFFHCTTAGGHDSGWQDSTSYVDTGLTDNTTYTYQVKARDKSPGRNETAYSTPASGTTQIFNDSAAPTPDPMTWAVLPAVTVIGNITMTASTAIDVSGVEYSFECIGGGGHSSGWQDSETYTDTGLANNVTYTYTVTARDKSANQNQTAASISVSATTPNYFCSMPLAADFNHDCQVDFADFALMATNWSVCTMDPQSSCQ